MANAVAGGLRLDDFQPVAARPDLAVRGDDLDHIVRLEFVVKTNQVSVDAGALTVVPDIGMNAVCKVQRSGAGRQIKDFSARRQHEDIFPEKIFEDVVNELHAVLGGILRFEDLPQPARLAVEQALRCAPLLIHPMGGNTVFCSAMHLLRADLHFKRDAGIAQERCVQRAVHIRFWRGNIVLKPAGERLPACVQNAERGIAVVDRIDNHADCDQIIDFIDAAIDALHLAINAVQMLWPPADGSVDTGLRYLLADALHGIVQYLFAIGTLLLKLAFDVRILIRHEVLKRKILKLALDGAHTKAVRERCIDIQRFLGLAHPLIGIAIGERSHIVQSVGQFDDDHAHIRRNGEEQLAKVFGLLLLLGDIGLLS